MANTVRSNEEKKNIFSFIEKYIKTKQVFEDGVPVSLLPKITFLAVLLIFYIGNTHYAERNIRKIEKYKMKVDDLRAYYTTLKAELMYASKQSEVAKKVNELGLEETLQAPYKIKQEEKK